MYSRLAVQAIVRCAYIRMHVCVATRVGTCSLRCMLETLRVSARFVTFIGTGVKKWSILKKNYLLTLLIKL